MVCRLVEVTEQLLDPLVCRSVAFDLSLPAACGGVFDKPLFDREARV